MASRVLILSGKGWCRYALSCIGFVWLEWVYRQHSEAFRNKVVKCGEGMFYDCLFSLVLLVARAQTAFQVTLENSKLGKTFVSPHHRKGPVP